MERSPDLVKPGLWNGPVVVVMGQNPWMWHFPCLSDPGTTREKERERESSAEGSADLSK